MGGHLAPRRSAVVGTMVRSFWEDEAVPGGGRWYDATVTELKDWVGGVYPGEGYTGPGWYYELRYAETGEFEYVREGQLWKVVEPTYFESPGSPPMHLGDTHVTPQHLHTSPTQGEDLLDLGSSLWANGSWS